MAAMIDDGNQKKNPNTEPMPDDFWEMVRAARARAITEVEKKRRSIYQSFRTDEVKSGKRIPMPSGYLQETEMAPPLEEPAQEPSSIIRTEQIDAGHQPIEKPVASASNIDAAPASDKSLIESSGADLIVGDANRFGLSFKEAALLILKREGRSMSAKEIVSIALEEGMLKSVGKTPDASLAGQIYTDIHRTIYSPFAIVGPRTYALKPNCPESDAESERDAPRYAASDSPSRSFEAPPLQDNLEFGSQTKMSYKQAAVYLLGREGRPMTAKEIVKTAIDEGIIESSGKTPDATLAGQLYTEMQRSKGRFPVKLIGPRTYALADWYKKSNSEKNSDK